MPKFYGAIDLVKNELQNAIIQNLGSAPGSPVKGQIYFNSTDNIMYYWDGTAWIAAKGGAPGGAAGGDLGGTYPNPTVVKASGAFSTSGQLTVPNGIGPGGGILFGTQAVQMSASNPNQLTVSATAGMSLSGSLNFGGSSTFKVTNMADPTAAQDGATKSYVDNAIAGLSWKDSVRAATTVAGTLATSFASGSAIDGVALATGNRILIKNQATMSENGVYVVTAGAPTRATDFDLGTEVIGAAMYVEEGTVNNSTAWTLATDGPITIGTTSLVFTQFGGGAIYSGGAGIVLNGSVFDVVAGDTTLTVAADSIVVNTSVIPTLTLMNTALAGKTSKYAGALVGTASPEVVTHNLNTRDVSVTILNGASPYTVVECDWDATSLNTITLRYNPVLGAGYRVVVMG